MTEAFLSLLEAAGLPAGLWALARLLDRRLDDRGLFRRLPFALLPALAGGALAFAGARGSGLAAALDPLAVWSPESAWRVSWNELVARHLSPEVLIGGLTAAAPFRDRPTALALAGAALAAAAAGARAAFLWRSRAAWRGAALFAARAAAWAATLHAAVVLAFWTVHWLNFWLLFILLLFVELRRREGEGSKYQAS